MSQLEQIKPEPSSNSLSGAQGQIDSPPPGPDRKQIPQMFDSIAARYDLLNHLLSANLDRRWRREVAERLPEGNKLEVLDLACGTGDQLLAMYETKRMGRGVGVDLSEKMLAVGLSKIKKRGLEDRLSLHLGDAEQTKLESDGFDAVTISFGIRNLPDTSTALKEMRRLIRPGGRVIILEFSIPTGRLFRAVYLLYLRYLLPILGAVISGDGTAYRYLNETIETFPHGESFCQLMRQAGLVNVMATELTGGIASIYVGEK